MLDYQKLSIFILISTSICLAPGPSMLFAITQGLSGVKGRVIAGIAGTLSGNLIWITLVAVGVGTLLSESQTLFVTLKYVGAAYLFYLGVKILLKRSPIVNGKLEVDHSLSLKMVYLQGLFTTLSNPKALLVYLSFLPQFVGVNQNYTGGILFWGMIYLLVVLIVMGGYALSARKISDAVQKPVFTKYTEKVLGLGFMGAAFSVIRSGN